MEIELNIQSQNQKYGSDIMCEIIIKHILLELAKFFERDKAEKLLCNYLSNFKNQEMANIMDNINQNLPIVKVYFMAEFKDYSNFFRVFKNEFGLTPKDYFNALKNKSN